MQYCAHFIAAGSPPLSQSVLKGELLKFSSKYRYHELWQAAPLNVDSNINMSKDNFSFRGKYLEFINHKIMLKYLCVTGECINYIPTCS